MTATEGNSSLLTGSDGFTEKVAPGSRPGGKEFNGFKRVEGKGQRSCSRPSDSLTISIRAGVLVVLGVGVEVG